MAGNKIDAIFASKAIEQITKVKDELAAADAELINISQKPNGGYIEYLWYKLAIFKETCLFRLWIG